MTATEFRVSCAIMGISYTEMSRRLNISPITPQRWARGLHPVPYASAVLIRQMVEEYERRAECAKEEQ